jgi:hypothetical protein
MNQLTGQIATKAGKDGLYLMLLGAAVFLLLGFALERSMPVSTADFRLMYYSARCLLNHHDPYQESELRKTYEEQGGATARDTPMTRKTETQYIYLPTAFSITVPFALLPFGVGQIVWLLATAASMLLGAFLMWEVSAQWAPLLSGALLGFSLANCELFLAIAGPGGIAIGLCVAAVWCFIRERFVLFGVVALAVCLMLKPHDGALVWLYFFLAGGIYRKRALQTLLSLILMSAPALAWTSHVAPGWMREFLVNLAANSAHGALSDPGVSSAAGHGIAMIISLQTVFSFFYDNPSFYNWASYLLCGLLLIVWIRRVRRDPGAPQIAWLALAPVAALSMLPVYHRLDDAKMLFLVVPACCLLWSRTPDLRRSAAMITTAQIVLTCAIPWAIIFALIKRVPPSKSTLVHQLLIAVQVMPAPLILLLVAVFYLWVYLRSRQIVSEEISG